MKLKRVHIRLSTKAFGLISHGGFRASRSTSLPASASTESPSNRDGSVESIDRSSRIRKGVPSGPSAVDCRS